MYKAKIRILEAILVGFMTLIIVIVPFHLEQIFAQESSIEQVEVESEEDQRLQERQRRAVMFLNQIKQEIDRSEEQLLVINDDLVDTEAKLVTTRMKIDSLEAQINNINRRINNTESQIVNVQEQIEMKKTEIEQLEYEIEQKKVEISFQKQMFLKYLEVIYRKQSDFNNISEENIQINTLKLLFGDQKAGDILTSLHYSEVFENEGRKMLNKLVILVEEQETQQQILLVKQRTLQLLLKQLAQDKKDLEMQKRAKGSLLKQTEGQEQIYQELLEETRKQQEQVALEIQTLKENLDFIRKRMKILGSEFDPKDYQGLIELAGQSSIYKYLNDDAIKAGFEPIWPVSPSRGVSAYYLEASYQRTFGFPHNAIDIRAYQDTPIKSAEDGIVYKAQDNGYGYSYIIVAHKGGYMTVYGHIYNILVRPGQIVKAGDIIGKSGGMPGTKGAGVYTTGPHLHFEIIKDGRHVDPMLFMNLTYLDFEAIPDKYLAKALGDQQKYKRKGKVKRALSVDELVDLNSDSASN